MELFWRQKIGIKWAQQGDLNTKNFHSTVFRKRRKMLIPKLKRNDGSWIDTDDQLADEVVAFFTEQFAYKSVKKDTKLMPLIPEIIIDDKN